MTRESAPADTTLSVRVLWPFARVFPGDPRALAVASQERFNVADLVEPDARIPHAMAMRMLAGVVAALGDPLLGVKAGQSLLPGDLDVLGYAASSSSTLQGSIECFVRYMRVLHGGATFSLVHAGEVTTCAYRVLDGVEEPAAAHDFVATAFHSFTRLCSGRDEPYVEVRFAHEERANLATYRRIFRCPIKFGAAHTALVFPTSRLSWPFLQADPVMGAAFEARVRDKLVELTRHEKTSVLVGDLIRSSLPNGEISMASLARRMSLSVSTLRRRLAEEGTTHSQLLEQVRKELALTLLARPHISASEISFLLQFSHPEAFHRAFKRWTGMSTTAYRKQRE